MRRMVLVAALVLFGGCFFGSKMKAIAPQMTEAQVVAQLGRPDGIRKIGDFTVYTYANKMVSGWSNARADYNVVFDAQGRVQEYGPGEVRQQPNNTLVIVPVGPL